MDLTIMGLILIPIGIMLFIFKYKLLIYLAIFFSGFTGSSVIKLNEFSLQPSYFFMILFLVKYIFEIIKYKKIQKPNLILLLFIFISTLSLIMPYKPNLILLLFIFISTLSLIMPYILEGKHIIVLNPDNNYEFVEFRSQNITQYIYLIFGFIVYIITKDYIGKDKEKLYKCIKIFLYSSMCISLLGIYQEIAYLVGLPFDEIFRDGVHGNIQPYGSFIRVKIYYLYY